MTEQTPEWPEPKKDPIGDVARWRDVTDRVRKVAEINGWSRSEVAKRSDMKPGTFYQVIDGTYASSVDRFVEILANWLISEDEAEEQRLLMPVAPSFIRTPTAERVMLALSYARTVPTMAVVTLGAGMGKTAVARHIRATMPHTHLVTMRPKTSSVRAMMDEVAEEVNVKSWTSASLDRAVGAHLKRNGRHTLLILDEAQHLQDNAVNQLRYLLDEYGVALALLGNEELYGRFGSATTTPQYAQIHSRVGIRIKQLKPKSADINMLLDAWKLEDRALRHTGHLIAQKPGALRQLNNSLMMAAMIANGNDRAMTDTDLKAAWENRGLEPLS